MKIVKAFPPLFKRIAETFPVKGKQGILYAWGDRIYNPSGVKIPPSLLAHEELHGKRQLYIKTRDWEKTIRNWWEKYLTDPEFRLNEEVLAHRVEAADFISWAHTDVTYSNYLNMMAERLSSPLYGSLVSKDRAMRLILGLEEL